MSSEGIGELACGELHGRHDQYPLLPLPSSCGCGRSGSEVVLQTKIPFSRRILTPTNSPLKIGTHFLTISRQSMPLVALQEHSIDALLALVAAASVIDTRVCTIACRAAHCNLF